MYMRLHVQYPLFFSDFYEISFSSTDIPKMNFKNQENPSTGIEVVQYGWTETDRQT
jgi:hypothetical protein